MYLINMPEKKNPVEMGNEEHVQQQRTPTSVREGKNTHTSYTYGYSWRRPRAAFARGKTPLNINITILWKQVSN